jgi:copper chaperone
MTTLTIQGMTCQHCVKAVTEALSGVPGVRGASVDLQGGTARVEGDAAPEALLAAVREEGYEAALAG